jgi:small subunit ribosomal protein S16
MVRIRLRRVGQRHQPSYRIVVADIESPRDGRFLEIIGSYIPTTEPFTFEVQEDRVYEWMSKGAQPSDSMVKLFKITGVLDRYERYKKGEALETLLEEAAAASKERAEKIKAS